MIMENSEKYGIFLPCILKLNNEINQVMTSWTDQTANTYTFLNENVVDLSGRIWTNYAESQEVFAIAKRHYDESEFDEIIGALNIKINSV